jgi:hypothetical protein
MPYRIDAWVCARALAILLVTTTASAQITARDLQVAARALSFLQKPLSGEVSVGIVYVRNNPQSLAEGENLQRLLLPGLKVGNITLRPTLVELDEAPRASVGVFFLTAGVGAEAERLASISRARQLPCFTTDLSQVAAGRCAVGIRSEPKVEIVVNHAAAAASGATFSTVFRMMITEV